MKDLKKDFRFFDKGEIYLDSAATAQTPEAVINAMADFDRTERAPIYKGVYPSSEQATARYEQIRQQIADWFSVSPNGVIFTSGATEAINLVMHSWAMVNLKAGDEILISPIEHHANLVPWQVVAQKTGAILKFIDFDLNTRLLGLKESDFTSKTKLVCVTAESNVLGQVWQPGDLQKLIELAHSVGARVLIDAAQAAAHCRHNLTQLGADFFVVSAHKMMGPVGLGILCIKEDVYPEMEPYQYGGSMVSSVQLTNSQWQRPPQMFEAGSAFSTQVIGLGALLTYFKSIDRSALIQHEQNLIRSIIKIIDSIEGSEILGNRQYAENGGHLVSFIIDGVHPHDVASLLGMQGIAVRAGNHCAQPLHQLLGMNASLRVSVHCYTTQADVNAFGVALHEVVEQLREYSR